MSIRSYRKYYKQSLLEILRKKDLPDYSIFICIDAAYIDLTTEDKNMLMKLHQWKIKGKKGNEKRNSKPWFDSDIKEAIRVRDKLKERYLKTKLHADPELFEEQRNSVQQKIKNKKTNFVSNQK